MRKIFVAISLMLFVNIFSQTSEKNIIIKDLATNLPIEGATVLILKTRKETIWKLSISGDGISILAQIFFSEKLKRKM